MKKFNVFNIGCYLDGEKIIATSFEEDFAKKFALAKNGDFFTVNQAENIFNVEKRDVFFIARSVFKTVNGILEQKLQILIPTKNIRIVEEILTVFSRFTFGLLLKEDDPINSLDAWRMRMPEKNIH